MSEHPRNKKTEILETDIVFDCPHCTKSLAIDQSATDCGQEVEVPGYIEEIEYIEDDGTTEENQAQIEELSSALEASHLKVQQLVANLQEVTKRRNRLEEERTKNLAKFKLISQELNTITASLGRIMSSLRNVSVSDNSQ